MVVHRNAGRRAECIPREGCKRDPCWSKPCRPNEDCVPEPKNCFTAPCPQYRCQVKDPCALVRCRVVNGCQTECKVVNGIAECLRVKGCNIDPCRSNPCRRDQDCVPEPKNCFTTPCPQYRCQLRDPCSTVRCASINSCSTECKVVDGATKCVLIPGCEVCPQLAPLPPPPEGCSYDEYKDEWGCSHAKLVCPCAAITCPQGQKCVPDRNACTSCLQYRCDPIDPCALVHCENRYRCPTECKVNSFGVAECVSITRCGSRSPCTPNPCKDGEECVEETQNCGRREACPQYVCKAPKPGTCPNRGNIGACVELCSGDSVCPGSQKCCPNGCGHSCVEPRRSRPECRRNDDCDDDECAECVGGKCVVKTVKCPLRVVCTPNTCPAFPRAVCTRTQCSCKGKWRNLGFDVTDYCSRRG